MEVVLPDGTILDLLSKIQKDNTGYDLKHLFIGAEGTLGVITKVAIKCPRLPTARNVAFLACESFDMVRKTLTCAKDELGEILAAFEFIDEQMLDQVGNRKKIPVKHGERNYPFCILLETQGSNDEHDMAKLESFVEKSITLGNVVDGTLAQDMKQVRST
jgi:FAD/FMN-containing dehydrogenases